MLCSLLLLPDNDYNNMGSQKKEQKNTDTFQLMCQYSFKNAITEIKQYNYLK